jgi:putative flippase GtrA
MLIRIGINREKDSKLVKRTVYTVTGAIGLAVTFLSSLFTSSYLTQNPVIIKIISVGLSFFVVFILRTAYVFE